MHPHPSQINKQLTPQPTQKEPKRTQRPSDEPAPEPSAAGIDERRLGGPLPSLVFDVFDVFCAFAHWALLVLVMTHKSWGFLDVCKERSRAPLALKRCYSFVSHLFPIPWMLRRSCGIPLALLAKCFERRVGLGLLGPLNPETLLKPHLFQIFLSPGTCSVGFVCLFVDVTLVCGRWMHLSPIGLPVVSASPFWDCWFVCLNFVFRNEVFLDAAARLATLNISAEGIRFIRC